MRQSRTASLLANVTSLISGGQLSVTVLGRNVTTQRTEEHQIKRSTHLCSNRHLQAEIDVIYTQVTCRLIGAQQYPVILMEWSDPVSRYFCDSLFWVSEPKQATKT